jgi:hypothetical protein
LPVDQLSVVFFIRLVVVVVVEVQHRQQQQQPKRCSICNNFIAGEPSLSIAFLASSSRLASLSLMSFTGASFSIAKSRPALPSYLRINHHLVDSQQALLLTLVHIYYLTHSLNPPHLQQQHYFHYMNQTQNLNCNVNIVLI